MQPRQTFITLMAAMAVFYMAFFLLSWLSPPPPPSTQPAGSDTTTQPSGGPSGTAGSAPASAEAPGTSPSSVPSGDIRPREGASREIVRLGSSDDQSPYPMLLEIDPRGADVTNAWIRGHHETVDAKAPYHILQPVTVGSARTYGDSFATTVRFDDRKLTVALSELTWTLDASSTESRKVWTLPIELADGRVLARVVKTYELPAQPPASKTYDLKLSLRIENLSGEPGRLIVTQRGAVGIRREDPRYEDRLLISGIRVDDTIETAKHARADVVKVSALSLAKDDDKSRVAWVAEANKYFTCIMAPVAATPDGKRADFSTVDATTLGKADLEPEAPSDTTVAFVSAPIHVAAGDAAELHFDCYIGPKSKTAFQSVPVYESRDYYGVIRAGFYACAFSGLTAVMMKLLNIFHWVGFGNYGIAIIILVLVVRGVLHPITKMSQVNMFKMQKNMVRLQPKLEAVKQKYANDRMALNQAMMQVYKDEGVNPAGGMLSCLPMLLQIPIWGALWQALSSTIEMRHAPFDGWWIRNLAGPDALIQFNSTIHIPLVSHYLTGPIHSFNLLPFLLGISQLLQMKYMPRPETQATGPAAAQMEQQRKMMMWMSVFFVVFLYNQPSGLCLYIMASNLFGILEQWRIRKHLADLDARKAAEAAAMPEAVGAGAKGAVVRKAGPQDKPKEPSWLQRKWQELQKQAEEAKRQQGQRKREEK